MAISHRQRYVCNEKITYSACTETTYSLIIATTKIWDPFMIEKLVSLSFVPCYTWAKVRDLRRDITEEILKHRIECMEPGRIEPGRIER